MTGTAGVRRLRCLAALALMAGPGAMPPAPCGAADTDSWVAEAAARVQDHDGLLRFALETWGDPLACDGAVTSEFDGAEFGVVVWRFATDATFRLETMPPEVSVVTLRDAAGFQRPDEVMAVLRAYTSGLGLSIAWEDPERSLDGDERTEQYWDPDSGLNASATLNWSGGTLVAVRVALAP